MYSYMHPIFTFCSHLVILKSIKNTKQGHVDGPRYFKSWLFYGKILVLQVNIIGIEKHEEPGEEKSWSKTTGGQSSGNISELMADGSIQGLYFITVGKNMGRT